MRALGLVVLVACGGASSSASEPVPVLDCTPSTATTTVGGVVFRSAHHSALQTTVMFKSACSTRPPRYAFTGDRGIYSFADLPADTYDVFVAGFARATPQRIRVDGGGEMTVSIVVERD